MTDMDIIDPAGGIVQFGGRDVTIRPLKVGQLPAFARAIKPLAGMFDKLDSITTADLLDLIADHGDNIVKAVSIASGISEKELQESDPVQLIALVAPIIKVNTDFFRLRLLMQA